jgi:hypothetical protein
MVPRDSGTPPYAVPTRFSSSTVKYGLLARSVGAERKFPRETWSPHSETGIPKVAYAATAFLTMRLAEEDGNHPLHADRLFEQGMIAALALCHACELLSAVPGYHFIHDFRAPCPCRREQFSRARVPEAFDRRKSLSRWLCCMNLDEAVSPLGLVRFTPPGR